MSALEAPWRRLHPASMISSSLKGLPGAIAGIVGALAYLREQGMGAAVAGAVAVVALIAALTFLHWLRFRFRVGAREIAIEQGILSRSRRVIPFDRVRDVGIERKLLARLIGTARVRIETGGGSSDEGDLDMIALADAERLRNHIRGANAGSGMPAVEEEGSAASAPAEPVVFAMDLRRILTAGLFNFSLLFIALLFGALQYLDDLRLFDLDEWVDADRGRAVANTLGWRELAVLAGLLALLGIATGLVRTLAREYGFRLTAGPNGLRRRRGLLTLSEVLIPARRTEAARVERRWFSGLFGWRNLAFQTLGADAKEGGVQAAAPLASQKEIRPILDRAGFPDLPDVLPVRPPARALIRRCAPHGITALLLAALGAVQPALALLALLPVPFALLTTLRWRNDRHLIGETALFTCHGLLKRTWWIVPYEKLQALTTARGPLQRRLGLATLRLDTAGAPMLGGPRLADIPADSAPDLAAALLAAFYRHRAAARKVTLVSR